ncbi:DAK2 domain-containing protein [Janibacter melonis]|uniref:DAK2 domain-containing protein n=1 Tax=Janibacter melonis TaxID=262209 RepID=UPI001E3CAD64|nr:DAK2 domain-containing protein [Janibacter melonis]MCB5990697.1 DAK2 domain-containing protein [Janibacter melonis]
MLTAIDAAAMRRWAVVTRAALAARRAEIDALNVFPVPDGDTGTNMYLTLDQALDAVRVDHEARGVLGEVDLPGEAAAMSRAAMLSARGNSGVILSQLIRGISDELSGAGTASADAPLLARALGAAARRARESVVRPQEGTILTVADRAAEAAAAAAADGADLPTLTERTVQATRDALAATPSQLPVLAAAGVVDAGGAGYLLFLEALDRVVRDHTPLDRYEVDDFTMNLDLRRRPEWSTGEGGAVTRPAPAEAGGPAAAEGPAFEVMYLLDSEDEQALHDLRCDLDALGDSVVLSGDGTTTKVHVHTDDIGAALQAGLAVAPPREVQVTPLVHAMRPHPRVGLAVVACAAGPGIAALVREVGASVVSSGPGRRASAGELLDAVRETRAGDVILLPNDRDTVLAARACAQAAGQEGQHVHVVESGTAVQGLAALAVYDPGADARHNEMTMTRAAAATRHGAVTTAVKAGLTSGGPCEVGDALGVVAGDIAIVGQDLCAVAAEVVSRLAGSGADLVTLVVGEDADDELVAAARAAAEALGHGVEVEVVDGGQPAYPLLVGVE